MVGERDVVWYLVDAPRGTLLAPDPEELVTVRWWSRSELRAVGGHRTEPHLARFLAKVDADR